MIFLAQYLEMRRLGEDLLVWEVTEQSVETPGQGAGRHDGGGEHEGGGRGQREQQTEEKTGEL